MTQIPAKRVVITSFLVDLLDFTVNVIVALFTGSVVMLSESLQGLSDFVAAGFLLIGLRNANRKADKTHPFGYGREVFFWTLLAAIVMLAITATFSFYYGFQRFINPQPIENIFLAYAVLLLAVGTNGYSFSLGFRRLLKGQPVLRIIPRVLQSSLVETKAVIVLDLMGTSSALLGLISLVLYGLTGNQRFDGIGAMIIGLTLAMLSFLLIISIKDFLIGKSASEETQEKIIQTALQNPHVIKVLDLKTVYIGPSRLLVNLEINLRNNLTTDEIERLVDTIKADIQQQVPDVHHVQIELETPDEELAALTIPVGSNN